MYMAEREGFEPSIRLLAYTRSRRAPSTARPPLLFNIKFLLFIQNKNMIVKKIILLSFFVIGNFQILLSLYYKNFSIGFLWYSINSNSLVGFQGFLERYSYLLYNYKIDINKYLIFFLDVNFFFIIGILFLLFPCFLIKVSQFLTQPLLFFLQSL